MAQAEDTELRDLAMEALEKNGSLAKIRALLRANVFLIFEEDSENIKQNVSLDNILKLPEGLLCLSLVHEFLEFCNLKNTLFVYMSESRQGKDYTYESKHLNEKLKLFSQNRDKEPILVTLIKKFLQPQNDCFTQPEKEVLRNGKNYKHDENNTYIVHEDSSTSSTSHSNYDNSSDERNKIHLRLQLDNSDTDTSSDSAKDKTSSEYIPNEHIIHTINENKSEEIAQKHNVIQENLQNIQGQEHRQNAWSMVELKANYSSSDSTSYVDLKPLSPLDKVLFNTAGLPNVQEKSSVKNIETNSQLQTLLHPNHQVSSLHNNSTSPKHSLVIPICNSEKNQEQKEALHKLEASANDLSDYSFDFTTPPVSGGKESSNKDVQSSESVQDYIGNSPQMSLTQSPHNKSTSSQSSISISDVADIISERSIPYHQEIINDNDSIKSNNSNSMAYNSKGSLNDHNKLPEDNSLDSDSPVPSLSNLSLNIHSD